jgi:cell division septum initiation protein DivIVA
MSDCNLTDGYGECYECNHYRKENNKLKKEVEELKQQLAEKDKVIWLLGETYTTFTNHCEEILKKKQSTTQEIIDKATQKAKGV